MGKTREEINSITEDIVREVLDTLQDKVYRIILFGSYARGDYDNESDMDIMIISDADPVSVRSMRKPLAKAASRVSLKNDIEVSMIIRDRRSFENQGMSYPFYRSVQEEGVRLYG